MQEQLTDTEKGQRILEAIAESDEEVEEIKEEMQTIEGKMERLREEIDEIRDAENYVIEQLKRAAKIISELDSIEDDLVGRIWNEYEEAQRNLGFINRSNENKADDREKVRSYESAIKALKELRNIVAEAESAEERNERPEFRLAEQLEDYIQTEESLFQRERKFNFEDVHPLVPLEKIDTQNVMYPKGSSVFKKALVQAIEDHNSKDNALREIRRAKEDFKSDYKKEEGTEAAIHDFEDRVDKLVRDMERTKEAYVGMLTGSGLGINKGKKDIDEIKGSDKDSNDEFSNLEYGNDEIPGLKTVLEELKEIRDDLSRILGEENEIKKEWGEARGELQEAKERAKEEIEDIERIERMEVAFTTENQDQLFNDKILLPKNPQRTQEGREIYQRALAAAANELGVSSGNLGNEIQYLLQYRDRLEEELEEAEEIEEKDFEIEEEQKEEIKEAAEELYNKIEIFWDLMKNHAGEGQVLPSEINEDRNDIVEVIKDIENLIERDII